MKYPVRVHFAYYTSNNHRTEYTRFLNEKYTELGIVKYRKNDNRTFETLMKHGNPKLATRYAKRIINEYGRRSPAEIAPGTKVFELVEELARFLSEEIRDNIL